MLALPCQPIPFRKFGCLPAPGKHSAHMSWNTCFAHNVIFSPGTSGCGELEFPRPMMESLC